MDFYIPKYTDIYIKDGHMGTGIGLKGEYRAILIGEDKRIKSDTGWKLNTLLDNGISNLRSVDSFYRMYLGDSDVAVNVTQVGLQGSVIGTYEYVANASYAVNAGAPDYEVITIEEATWAPGESTGTIKEFVIIPNGGNYSTDSAVRVVLASPIVKGPSDELTIQHRLTWYPQIADTTGTIDISGVAYNYVMRHINIAEDPTSHPLYFEFRTGNYGYAYTGEITANTEDRPLGNQIGYASDGSIAYGGSPGSYYSERTHIFSVDDGNDYGGEFRSQGIGIRSNTSIGAQFRWGKVSDDSPLIKLNTHVLTFSLRLYLNRYVP